MLNPIESLKKVVKLGDDLSVKIVGATGSISIAFMEKQNKKRSETIKELERIQNLYRNGCGNNYWMNGLKYQCEGKKVFSIRLCDDCRILNKKLKCVLGGKNE